MLSQRIAQFFTITLIISTTQSLPQKKNVLVSPKDQVVAKGGSATFNCRIKFDVTNDAIRWTVKKGGDSLMITIYQSYPKDFLYDKEKYTIDNPGPNAYNLIVKNVDENDVGIYTCQLIANTAVSASAELTMEDEVKETSNLKILAMDEDGNPTDVMTPNRKLTLHATYSGDPQYVTFYNGTHKPIIIFFMRGHSHIPGAGFEKLVSNAVLGKGWVAFDFAVPYCYEDGIIQCTLIFENADTNVVQKNFPIGVMVQPQIHHDGKPLKCGQELKVTSGSSSNFQCKLSAVYPKGSLRWSGCNSTKPESVEDSTTCLFTQTIDAICSPSVSTDIGCSASNAIGAQNCSIRLSVREKQLYTTCAHEVDPDEKIVRGGNKTIGCYIEKEGHSGNITYKWYKNGREIVPTVRGKYQIIPQWKLLVHDIQKQDEGLYTCRIRNHDGLGNINAGYDFKVKWCPRLDGPDHRVIIGDDIHLKCNATHLNEKITKLQWYLNGNAIGGAITDPTYIDFLYNIKNVQREDKGLYKCEVTGQATTGSDTYLLKVYCEC